MLVSSSPARMVEPVTKIRPPSTASDVDAPLVSLAECVPQLWSLLVGTSLYLSPLSFSVGRCSRCLQSNLYQRWHMHEQRLRLPSRLFGDILSNARYVPFVAYYTRSINHAFRLLSPKQPVSQPWPMHLHTHIICLRLHQYRLHRNDLRGTHCHR